MSAEDLRSVLEGVGDAGAGPDLTDAALEAEVRRLTTQVRRRRAARGAALLTGAAAAVVAGAIGVQALEGPDPAPPAQTVTPTPSVEPSPEPTDESTDEPVEPEPEPLGEVTEHPLLPPAEPLLEGMIEATTDDWRLVGYEPRDAEGPGAVHYLMDPAGVLHEVPTPLDLARKGSEERGYTGSFVGDWLPGTSLVVVGTVDVVEGMPEYAVHDLLTGAMVGDFVDRTSSGTTVRFVGDGTSDLLVTQIDWYAFDALTVDGIERASADGATRWRVAGFTAPDVARASHTVALLSPDGTRLVLNDGPPRVVDATDLDRSSDLVLPYDGAGCAAEEWWGDDHVVLGCGAIVSDDGRGDVSVEREELWLAPVDGGAPTLLTDQARGVRPFLAVEDRLVAWTPDSEDLVLLDRDGTRTSVPGDSGFDYGSFGEVAGRAVGTTLGAEVTEVVAVDLGTGERTVLVPSSSPSWISVLGGHR